MEAFSMSLIALGIFIDVASLFFGIRRLRGDGPSGIPLVALPLYAIGVILFHQQEAVGLALATGLGFLLLAFHLACHYLILLWPDSTLPK